MPDDGVKRKLAAILSADIAGYTRLMSEDEVETLQRLKTYRELIRVRVEEHNGRVVDNPGDNILAEFPSALDAARCAVEIQRVLKNRNADLATNRRMDFRIGIHLGDVMVDGDRIYGDGVNIAARMEELSEIGGICISDAVHAQVKGKLDVGFDDLGKQSVKNISEPIQAFAVVFPSSVADASIIRSKTSRKSISAIAMAIVLIVGLSAVWHYVLRSKISPEKAFISEDATASLPEKPSIAVLPFDNMSGDPEQEYFSDGMTDAVITRLSMNSGLTVISRHSTFYYKGRQATIQDISKDLGARYVVQGSVRRANDTVRIASQLIDATTDAHIWAANYIREIEDVFALQDEIAFQIAASVNARYQDAELERVTRVPTHNLSAYEFWLMGFELFYRLTRDSMDQARQHFERAIELDPRFADAYAWLGHLYHMAYWFQWDDGEDYLRKGFELVNRAVILDESSHYAQWTLGFIQMQKRQYGKAIISINRAISMRPSDDLAYNLKGHYLMLAEEKYDEAIKQFQTAIRLNPRPPEYYYSNMGWAYRLSGQYERAIESYEEALSISPDYFILHLELAIIYSDLDRTEEAGAEAAEVLRLNPGFSVKAWGERIPYKDPAQAKRDMTALRKAGLPD